MQKNPNNYIKSFPGKYKKILAIAALFQGAFSIDWIQELSGKKASQILSALQEGVGSAKAIVNLDTLNRL